jgi:adenine-specific DNA glycosylase
VRAQKTIESGNQATRLSENIWKSVGWVEQRDTHHHILIIDGYRFTQPILQNFTHTFTNFKLHITPMLIRLQRKPQQVQQAGSVWLDVEEALQAAIPTPVRQALKKLS